MNFLSKNPKVVFSLIAVGLFLTVFSGLAQGKGADLSNAEGIAPVQYKGIEQLMIVFDVGKKSN